MRRREFIKKSAVAGVGAYAATKLGMPKIITRNGGRMGSQVVLSTWNFGMQANETAWKTLSDGGSGLDAVEQGIMTIENDPSIMSVGYGGLPDEDMKVTLDASIMDWRGNCGAVGAIENIKNPIGVARKVMERTKHVMLAGEGAYKFALAQGFKHTDLLTDEARKKWLEWKESMSDKDNWVPEHDMNDLNDNHDTIGLLVLDAKGHLCAGVSTSGLAFKIHGRIGDSPIIGAGLYVDGKVGAAASTGVGEANIRIVGSHLVVESMRGGMTPQQACETAVKRAIDVHSKLIKADKTFQLAYIALNADGDVGGAAIRKGFQYALRGSGVNQLYDCKFLYND
ncbi:MAG TPA: N(4)-(beta-N-acetylglucosaminyl)-L-asparaginase [Candidatus Kryptonia bacterium]